MISCASKASLKTNVAGQSSTNSNRAVVCRATPKIAERMQQIALIGTASALLSMVRGLFVGGGTAAVRREIPPGSTSSLVCYDDVAKHETVDRG